MGVAEFEIENLEAHPSLREQVADQLRALLIAGEMRPGTVYSAPALATRFGVSATPVREAMQDLAKDGLIEAVRNKGFRVTRMQEKDLDAFTEIRELIEIPITARVAELPNRARLKMFRPMADAIVKAAEKKDLIGYVGADQNFHLELLALNGNPHLVEVVRQFRQRSRLYGLPVLAERGELEASAAEHHELLDLLMKGDASAVRSLMRKHLGHVRGIWAGD